MPRYYFGRVESTTNHHPFEDMRDSKGRVLGALVTDHVEEVRAHPEDQRWPTPGTPEANVLDVGTRRLFVSIQPARDGKKFGASQGWKLIGEPGTDATKEARDREVFRRIRLMIKRYKVKIARGKL